MKKRILSIIIVITLMIVMLGNTIGSVHAAGYSPRTSLPSNARTSIKEYSVNSTAGWGNYNPYTMFNVGNCTWYAFGRAWEVLGYFPSKLVFSGDANVWFAKNKANYDSGNGGFPYSTDSNAPALGAIAVWSKDGVTDGSGGHVAVVESITDNGNGSKTIQTSESGYASYFFKTVSRNTSAKGLGWSSYTFLGYIYILGNGIIDTEAPIISNVQVTNVSAAGYTVTCTVTDNVGVTSVKFPTWPSADDSGQPIWHEGVISGNTATCWIDVRDHGNKFGDYFTHIYAYDAAGNSDSLAVDRIFVDGTAPTISNVQITNVSASGYTVTCTVNDNVGVTSVKFPTWPSADDSGQPIWHEGVISGNTATCWIDVRDHGNKFGDYFTHIYAYDAAGNSDSLAVDRIFVDGAKPKITNVRISDVSESGYTVHCNIWDNHELSQVKFITWTPDNEGFDDETEEVWTTGFNDGVSEITYRVNTSHHNNEQGRYATHIFAYDHSGNYADVLLNASVGYECWNPVATKEYNGHTYALYDITNWNWSTVKTYCDSIGGYLVCITSAEEQAVINELLKSGNRSGYWIGATDQYVEAEWTWVTGENMVYDNWNADQPDNWNGSEYENYGIVYQSTGKWNDVSEDVRDENGNSVYGFICEIPHVHQHVYDNEVTKDATCTTEGIRTHTCGCGDSYTEIINALGHSYGNWEVVKDSTELAEGLKERECTVCGNKEQEIMPKKEHKHSFSSFITKAATCTEDGVRTFTCVCGEDSYTETIDALGHVLGNWTIETEVSCLKDGLKVRTCSRSGCTYEETEVLEASGHAYGGWKVIKEATDLETGLMEHECVNCGNKEQEIIKNGTHLHAYRLSSVIEAACESAGSKIYSCTCGESYSETIDALGHVMGQWSVQEEATCDMDGLRVKTCYREECDHAEYQIIEASGHDYGEWITLVEPTTEEEGVKERACANCGNKEYANIEKLEEQPPALNNPFKDVKGTDYFYNSVLWAVDNKITSGLSADMFAPNLGCTRAEVVTLLWRAAGRPEPQTTELSFEDVPENAYYAKAVLWAAEKGITSGYNDEVFGSNDQVTRCQFVTFLWRMENRQVPVRVENEFSDIATNAYYYKAVLWAVENGITAGYYQDLFAPDISCTRGQVVTFLYRAYK